MVPNNNTENINQLTSYDQIYFFIYTSYDSLDNSILENIKHSPMAINLRKNGHSEKESTVISLSFTLYFYYTI